MCLNVPTESLKASGDHREKGGTAYWGSETRKYSYNHKSSEEGGSLGLCLGAIGEKRCLKYRGK